MIIKQRPIRPSPYLPAQSTYVSDGLIRASLVPYGFALQHLPSYLGDVYSIQLSMKPFVK